MWGFQAFMANLLLKSGEEDEQRCVIQGEVCKKSVSFKYILLSMGKTGILTCPTKDLPFLFSSENRKIAVAAVDTTLD